MYTAESEKELTFSKSHRVSLASSLFQRVLRPILVMLALAAISASMPAHAQGTWQVDPRNSIAGLSLGSGPNALGIGLARVSGNVVFGSSDPADPFVVLSIKADGAPSTDYAEMIFISKRSTLTADGKLIVTGNLSVTRVERSVTLEPNEAYHGPEYGQPVVHTATQEVSVVFSDPRPSDTRSGTRQISGSTAVSREAFPQLLDALTQSDWPRVLVNDDTCDIPSTRGEDYAGATCTGTVIATVDNNLVTTGTAGGEGYYGFESTVTPDPERSTITLDLKVKQISAVASVIPSGATAAGK